MKEKFDAFVNIHITKPVEVEDSSALNQCMDLAFAWSDYIGIPHASIRAAAAKDVPTHYDKNYWDQVSDPRVGDLAIFGTSVGPYGHIDVWSNSISGGFRGFDQNWNGHSYCEYVNHNSTGVIMYLRPKIKEENVATVLGEMDVNEYFVALLGRPNTGDGNSFIGADALQSFYDIRRSPEGVAYRAKVEGLLAGGTAPAQYEEVGTSSGLFQKAKK